MLDMDAALYGNSFRMKDGTRVDPRDVQPVQPAGLEFIKLEPLYVILFSDGSRSHPATWEDTLVKVRMAPNEWVEEVVRWPLAHQ